MASKDYLTHFGPLDESTRQTPCLAFIERYAAQVDSMDLSAPFHTWYAPRAQFSNADGIVYHGGDSIWTWMRKLFGQFKKVQHELKVTHLLPGFKSGDLVLLDCDTTFWKSAPLQGEGIVVPRMLHFLVGEAEVDGQGTDGLQILEAKAWWDSAVLMNEMANRDDR